LLDFGGAGEGEEDPAAALFVSAEVLLPALRDPAKEPDPAERQVFTEASLDMSGDRLRPFPRRSEIVRRSADHLDHHLEIDVLTQFLLAQRANLGFGLDLPERHVLVWCRFRFALAQRRAIRVAFKLGEKRSFDRRDRRFAHAIPPKLNCWITTLT